MLDDVNNVSCV